MKIARNENNQALNEIACFFRSNKVKNIDDAIKKGIAVDCSRIMGNKDNFIVTIEFSNWLNENPEIIDDLKKLTRKRLSWHNFKTNEKIFVGFIDDPQIRDNKCSFFIIEKFLNEIIDIAC
ncbi:hypothetical protein [uncultured Flavobacterium sp.]|mgnify:CR=1 FL=1|uniref:hypothetical protein n=1 Tax=uncultured Flavobacterium sp. TaxID=165435 RepID=UPI0025922351|nr:hypothetical protein [uncultured Flavobacterium sp.]